MRPSEEDPVLCSGRREALFVLAVWCAAAAFTVGFCACFGYNRPADELRFVCGFPDWVFWGIVLPWAACLAICLWFAGAFMTDEPFGDEQDRDSREGHSSGERPDA